MSGKKSDYFPDLFRIVQRRLEEEYNGRTKIGNCNLKLKDFANHCRICLQKEILHPISNLFFQGRKLKDLIEYAVCIKLKNDDLPSKICVKCYSDIIRASFIKETGQNSENILKSLQIFYKKLKNDFQEFPKKDYSYVVEAKEGNAKAYVENEDSQDNSVEDDTYYVIFNDSQDDHAENPSEVLETEVIHDVNEQNENQKNRNNFNEKMEYVEIQDHTYSRMITKPVASLKKKTFDFEKSLLPGKVKTFEGAYIEQIKKAIDFENKRTVKTEILQDEQYEDEDNIYVENSDDNLFVEATDSEGNIIKYNVTSVEDSDINEDTTDEATLDQVNSSKIYWFVCKICKKYFSQIKDLKIHMQSHSNEEECDDDNMDDDDDEGLRCQFCKCEFEDTFTLTEHLKLHKSTVQIKEEMDEKEINEKSSANFTYDAKLLECDSCRIKFSSYDTYRLHVAQKHNEKNFLCQFCGKMFASGTGLQTHYKALHKGENKSKCEICKKTFSSYGNLRLHHNRHHLSNGRQYKCSYCSKCFVTHSDLKLHMQTHSGEKNFICQVCGKGFRLKTSYNSHTLIHTGERPHECKVCFRRFVQPTHLNYHTLTHTGERPHACHFCGKTFALKGNLTVHIRTHTGERPYVCDVCGKGFYDSSSMKKHKRGHHLDDISDTVIPAVLSITTDENSEL